MRNEESNITKMVKDALVCAGKKDEDLPKKVFAITYDAVIISLRSLRNFEITDEIKTTIVHDALTGMVEGLKEQNIYTSGLLEYANLGIEEALKVGAINE